MSADELTPEHLDQLARSLAMSGSLPEQHRHVVIDALRRLAAIEATKRQHPAGGSAGGPRVQK